MLLVVILLIFVVGSGGHSPPGHPTAPKNAGSANVQAAGLSSVVPSSIAKSCEALTKKDVGSKGFSTGVSCTSSDDPGFSLGVYYVKFDSLTDAKDAFATDIQEAGATFGTGDCNNPDSFPAECTWAVEGVKGTVGELAYYNLAATSSEPAASFVEWTIDSSKTLISVISRTVSDTNLRTWFDDCGGLGGSAVEERCATGGS